MTNYLYKTCYIILLQKKISMHHIKIMASTDELIILMQCLITNTYNLIR